MQRLASIDVGSNTLRLLIGEQTIPGRIRPIRLERRITRLGEHFFPSRALQPQATQRTIAALNEFVELMRQQEVSRCLAGATAVVRAATNGEAFIGAVQEQTGLHLRLLSGSEEARLSVLGVVSGLAVEDGPLAVCDIGGGSTELVWAPGGRDGPMECLSVPLGVVHLTEAFLQDDPPGAEACARLAAEVRKVLGTVAFADRIQKCSWIGTAGTITTLAAMRLGLRHYEPDRINGVVLERSWLGELCGRLAVMSLVQRREVPGLEHGREDIILAGALVAQELMEAFGFSRCTVSDGGLLEGLFLELCRSIPWTPERTGGEV
jgi:exopolyphosphatase/guanosine-5'-triphosphate,3'-diphosphate pyrophosphatase